MHFSVLTLFPDLVEAFFSHGIIGRAMEKEQVTGEAVNIRDFSEDRHHRVDDRPYGGGCGMVMTPGPLTRAIRSAVKKTPHALVAVMTPQGRPFDQGRARALAGGGRDLILVCGRYEGIDERVFQDQVDEEISLGDFVMTGGELAAMAVVDAVTRLIPGVLGGETSAKEDSFENQRLEHAQYTRPFSFEGRSVPEVLLGGHHGDIQEWRQTSSLKRTFIKRPDLFAKQPPTEEEKRRLKAWCRELEALVDG